jgi:hypothetical protein
MAKIKSVNKKSTVKATIVHESAMPFARQYRTSEPYGNYNVPAKDIVTDYSRWTLCNKSRFFVENVPLVKSAVEEIATYAVGEAWMPVFEGMDVEWGAKATSWLSNWFNIVDISGLDMHQVLWLSSLALDRDGDILCQLTYNESNYPFINLIGSHMVSGKDEDKRIYDGVKLDKNNKVISYQLEYGDNQKTQINASDSILLYEPRYPGQYRGYPTLATAIADWQDFRDIQNFEVEAIKQAAATSFIEKNEVGGVSPYGQTGYFATGSESQINSPLYYRELKGGMTRYFASNDPNANLEQMKNDRPGNLMQTYMKDFVLRGAFNCLGWPMEIAYDMTPLSSAATRAVLSKIERKLLRRQSILWKLWIKVVRYGISKAIQGGYLPNNKEWYKWTCTYPKSPTIDIGREVKNSIDLYKMGGTTLSDIYGQNGEKWDQKVDQKIRERLYLEEQCKKAGVDVNVIQMLTPNGNPPVDANQDNTQSN